MFVPAVMMTDGRAWVRRVARTACVTLVLLAPCCVPRAPLTGPATSAPPPPPVPLVETPVVRAYPVVRAGKSRVFLIRGAAPGAPRSSVVATDFVGGGRLLEADRRRPGPSQSGAATIVSSSRPCLGRIAAQSLIAFEALAPDGVHWSDALEVEGCPLVEHQEEGGLELGLDGEHPDARWLDKRQESLVDGVPLPSDGFTAFRTLAQRSIGSRSTFDGLDLSFLHETPLGADSVLETLHQGRTVERFAEAEILGVVRASGEIFVALGGTEWGTAARLHETRLIPTAGSLTPPPAATARESVDPPELPGTMLLHDSTRLLQLVRPAPMDAATSERMHWRTRGPGAAHGVLVYGERRPLKRHVELTLIGERGACHATAKQRRLAGITQRARFRDGQHSGPTEGWWLLLPLEGCPSNGDESYLVLPRTDAPARFVSAHPAHQEAAGHHVFRWTFGEAGVVFESRVKKDPPGVVSLPQRSVRNVLSISRGGRRLPVSWEGVVPWAAIEVDSRWFLLLARTDHPTRPRQVLELEGGSLVERWVTPPFPL